MKDWRAVNLLAALLLVILFNGHFLIGSLTMSYRSSFIYLFSVWLLASLFLFIRAHVRRAGEP